MRRIALALVVFAVVVPALLAAAPPNQRNGKLTGQPGWRRATTPSTISRLGRTGDAECDLLADGFVPSQCEPLAIGGKLIRAETNQSSSYTSPLSGLSATLALRAGDIGSFVETECTSSLTPNLLRVLKACCSISGRCQAITDIEASANLAVGLATNEEYRIPDIMQALQAALQKANAPTSPSRYARFHEITAPGRMSRVSLSLGKSLACGKAEAAKAQLSYRIAGLPTTLGHVRFRTGPDTEIEGKQDCEGLCVDSSIDVVYRCKENSYQVLLDYVFEWEIEYNGQLVSLPLAVGQQAIEIRGVNQKGDPQYPDVAAVSSNGAITCQWTPRQWKGAALDSYSVTDTPLTIATQSKLSAEPSRGTLSIALEDTACSAPDKRASVRIELRVGNRSPILVSTCDFSKACASGTPP